MSKDILESRTQQRLLFNVVGLLAELGSWRIDFRLDFSQEDGSLAEAFAPPPTQFLPFSACLS